jgi:hypothetical protein
MRGYKEHQGYATRLIFDAMKGQFIDLQVPVFGMDAPCPLAASERKHPPDAQQGPRSMQPMKQKAS